MNRVILPIPQNMVYGAGELCLGSSGDARYYITNTIQRSNAIIENAVALIETKLSDFFGSRTQGGELEIVLNISEVPSGVEVKNEEQAYGIESSVKDGKIYVTGYGDTGFYYAVRTLTELLSVNGNRLTFPEVKITDYPDHPIRGYFAECRFGTQSMTLDNWKELVDRVSELRLNHIELSIYSCWSVQYDGRVSEHLYVPIKKYSLLKTPFYDKYFSPKQNKWIIKDHLPPIFEQDLFGEILKYAKTKGITVFPRFASFAHNTLIPRLYPEVSSIDEDGTLSVASLCTNNPKTYEMLFNIYDEISDRYLAPNGIDSFSVGLDEVHQKPVSAKKTDRLDHKTLQWCQCPKCKDKDRMELFMNHAVKLISYLKSKGMKHIFINDDMMRDFPSVPEGEKSTIAKFYDKLCENGLEDVTVCDFWCYVPTLEFTKFKTTQPEIPLRRSVKPWNSYFFWTVLTDSTENIRTMTRLGLKEGAKAVLTYSAWYRVYDKNDTAGSAYSWNNEASGTVEEFNRFYAENRFPCSREKAYRAFSLLAAATDRIDSRDKAGREFTTKYKLLLNILSYYDYTYVRSELPYPRKFPGEAMGNLVENRKEYERYIFEIHAEATEAEELFISLSEDVTGNFELARRLVFEARNIQVLTEDYIALLRMYDLTADGRVPAACEINEIKLLARERKEARLSLMALFEETGEDYMFPTILRNNSVFMQYFADLEGYLEATPLCNVKLDFLDNTHFMSKAAYMLK